MSYERPTIFHDPYSTVQRVFRKFPTLVPRREEEKIEFDCLNPAEQEVLALMLAGQYLDAARLTQKNCLKHIDTRQLAFIYERAVQTKTYKKAVRYCHNRLSRNFNFPFVLYKLTTDQGTSSAGVGRWSLIPHLEKKFPDEPSGFSNYFPKIS